MMLLGVISEGGGERFGEMLFKNMVNLADQSKIEKTRIFLFVL